jgi:hypothetical protein
MPNPNPRHIFPDKGRVTDEYPRLMTDDALRPSSRNSSKRRNRRAKPQVNPESPPPHRPLRPPLGTVLPSWLSSAGPRLMSMRPKIIGVLRPLSLRAIDDARIDAATRQSASSARDPQRLTLRRKSAPGVPIEPYSAAQGMAPTKYIVKYSPQNVL